MICKKIDITKKIYNIFKVINKDKINCIKSFTIFNFLNLIRNKVSY